MILRATETGEGHPVALLHGLFGQAANFRAIQRRLAAPPSGAPRRVIALDLRNHGTSPHAPGMRYPDLAEDVLETLRSLHALPCALVGHSMGGKVAMAAALEAPAAISRLVVADIAPVRYHSGFRAFIAAMAAIPMQSGLTRAQADAALAPAINDPRIRGFLLQNLRVGDTPGWRLGLAEIAAGLPDIEDWAVPEEQRFAGPAVFLAGDRSDYIRGEHRPAIRALFPAARFVTLRDAGHWLHADNPDGFVSVVAAALA
jgi:pimeloyl-ACP methyl ester carboxylesterase